MFVGVLSAGWHVEVFEIFQPSIFISIRMGNNHKVDGVSVAVPICAYVFNSNVHTKKKKKKKTEI